MSAYFILHNRITDAPGMQEYLPKAIASLVAHGAELLVLDEQVRVLEGSLPYPRAIVIRFPSREQAMAWYESPAYQAILPLRLDATEGFLVLAESA